MFQGASFISLDDKGRLTVPTRYRSVLASLSNGEVVLTAHPHRCLLLYPREAWEPIRNRLLAAPSLETQSAMLRRLLVGFAQEEKLDSVGRVLIAPELRQYAELDKQKIWLVGQGHSFEIWSDAGWQQQQQSIFALGDKLLPPGLESFTL